MAFWNDSRHLDDFVTASDRTLNALVIVLLAAFALGSGAYYYGQMNPRVAPSAVSQPNTAPAVQAPQER
ncbi:MAG: hypothetical protein JSR99_07965 [Proteobacteria bacterium]|nr:hypothetical protein [Pseudomonadota bacterium]